MYNLIHPGWPYEKPTVAVVGCGGTGGYVAEGLCRLLGQDKKILLVDLDRVEQRNLVRQNFYPGDIGKFKSEALAHRLSDKFKRSIAYSTIPVSMLGACPEVIIGCVDNGPARRDIAEKVASKSNPPMNFYRGWWIDAGNGDNFGQLLIGNRTKQYCDHAFETSHEVCISLPLPILQRPDLLLEAPREPNCAEAVVRDEQSPTINQLMASLVLEVVRRIFAGTCPWMQLYLDMENGTLTPTFATPEIVSEMLHMRVKKLVYTEKEKKRR